MKLSPPTILYVSLWPWEDLRQRPQHLALQLSCKYNVIYTSAIPYFSGHSSKIISVKNFGIVDENKINNRLTVLNYKFLPSWRFIAIKKLNFKKWLSTISTYLERSRITVDVLWVSSPDHLLFIKGINSKLKCYDCMDNFEMFNQKLKLPEQKLFCDVDVCFVSASLLEKKALKFNKEVYLIPNGVDVEHFQSALESSFDVPEDLKNIPMPCVGFYGNMGTWLDYEIIEDLLKKTTYSIVLIGSVNSNEVKKLLKKKSRIFFLGKKPYKFLPAYLAHIPLWILPFQDTELTRAVDPVKVYEYLAAGRDVVATPLPAILQHKKHLKIASPEAFHEILHEYVKNPSSYEERIQKSKAMRKHSWQNRAQTVMTVLKNLGN